MACWATACGAPRAPCIATSWPRSPSLDLTQKQAATLWLINANPGVAQVSVAAALGMDRATMMSITDRLEERGLADSQAFERRPPPPGALSDARRHNTLRKVKARIAEHESRASRRLFKPAELAALLDALRELPGSRVERFIRNPGQHRRCPGRSSAGQCHRCGGSRRTAEAVQRATRIRRSARWSSPAAAALSCPGAICPSWVAIPPPPYAEVLRALEDSRQAGHRRHCTALRWGGLEIALGMPLPLGTSSTRMGMPEITLGILPGAGGTQRLPRLVGAEGALDMLLSGVLIDAARARDLGLSTRSCGDDALEGRYRLRATPARARRRSAAYTRASAPPPRPKPESPAPWRVMRAASRDAARNTWCLIHSRRQRTPLRRRAETGSAIVRRFARNDESLALRHVFFAERACGRIPGIDASRHRRPRCDAPRSSERAPWARG